MPIHVLGIVQCGMLFNYSLVIWICSLPFELNQHNLLVFQQILPCDLRDNLLNEPKRGKLLEVTILYLCSVIYLFIFPSTYRMKMCSYPVILMIHCGTHSQLNFQLSINLN
jgi:hypothetical protein